MDVVTVDETAVRTTRKTAAAVTTLQCSIDCRRNYAGFAADVERFAVVSLDDRHDSAVTRDAANRFGSNDRSILHLRRIVGVGGTIFRQRFRGSVNDNLIAVGATEAFVCFG